MSELKRLDCDAALRLLAAYLDGELRELDEESVRQHLQHCQSCFSRAEFERQLKSRLTELRHTEVSPALQTRIRTLLADYPDQREL
jgi:anti-sigma factor (TIGR02949 family)